jgi:hypothetical protein
MEQSHCMFPILICPDICQLYRRSHGKVGYFMPTGLCQRLSSREVVRAPYNCIPRTGTQLLSNIIPECGAAKWQNEPKILPKHACQEGFIQWHHDCCGSRGGYQSFKKALFVLALVSHLCCLARYLGDCQQCLGVTYQLILIWLTIFHVVGQSIFIHQHVYIRATRYGGGDCFDRCISITSAAVGLGYWTPRPTGRTEDHRYSRSRGRR